jgi:hypothetical protein
MLLCVLACEIGDDSHQISALQNVSTLLSICWSCSRGLRPFDDAFVVLDLKSRTNCTKLDSSGGKNPSVFFMVLLTRTKAFY